MFPASTRETLLFEAKQDGFSGLHREGSTIQPLFDNLSSRLAICGFVRDTTPSPD
jgi:hypothetical protein